jgi:hypothetical protein
VRTIQLLGHALPAILLAMTMAGLLGYLLPVPASTPRLRAAATASCVTLFAFVCLIFFFRGD